MNTSMVLYENLVLSLWSCLNFVDNCSAQLLRFEISPVDYITNVFNVCRPMSNLSI